MRVSVIGCGNISNVHLEILASMEGVEISSVADIVAEKADKAAEKYDCKAYYDYRKMLDEEHPDVVHICTPHYLHVEMAVEALSRDIHVLCEKPCAMNREELAKIKMAQLMSTCEYGVCFQNRYNASVMARLRSRMVLRNSFLSIGILLFCIAAPEHPEPEKNGDLSGDAQQEDLPEINPHDGI